MWTVVQFAVCLISVPGAAAYSTKKRVYGFEGGSVNFDCGYDRAHVSNNKYFVKGSSGTLGEELMRVWHPKIEANNGRFSMIDKRIQHVMTVTIKDLKLEDTGDYICAVDISFRLDEYFNVHLTVTKAPSTTTQVTTQVSTRRMDATKASNQTGITSHAEVIEVNGVEGGSVKIDCRYEKGFEGYEKYLTNVRWTLNNALIRTTKPNTLVTEGRYSLYDNTSVTVFTVTIKELRMSDAKTYWCAVEKTLMADDYTEFRLIVHPGSSSTTTTRRSSSITSLFTMAATPTVTVKIQGNTTTGHSKHQSSTSSPHRGLPVEMFVGVALGVMLLVFLLLATTYFVRRRRMKSSEAKDTQRAHDGNFIEVKNTIYAECGMQVAEPPVETLYSSVTFTKGDQEDTSSLYCNVSKKSKTRDEDREGSVMYSEIKAK
uniref:Natural cytotoxicity triggering receptor 2-like n=1 Tax=Erpetoichthys calabaricus TaxID=27687 RepID=A0A8C4RY88_ERPCA